MMRPAKEFPRRRTSSGSYNDNGAGTSIRSGPVAMVVCVFRATALAAAVVPSVGSSIGSSIATTLATLL